MSWNSTARGVARFLVTGVIAVLAVPVLATAALLARRRVRRRILWGTDAFLHYQYWSDAMREAGWDSCTFVASSKSPIFSPDSFDMTYDDLAPPWLRGSRLWGWLRNYRAFLYVVRHCGVFQFSFMGGPLNQTWLHWLEGPLYRLAKVRTMIIPIGSDYWRYSTIPDAATRHALMTVYGDLGRHEEQVTERFWYWVRHADVMVGCVMTEGLGRWDSLTTNPLALDLKKFPPRSSWSLADGTNAPVTIVHAPNHRGVKGTEFFLAAVEALKRRGLKIDLVLLEKVPNERVKEILRFADICLDKCVGNGYGQFAIESMASGAVVISSLEDDNVHNLHRQYSYLDECPLVSATYATLEETLHALIRAPALRQELGKLGVEYVRRYHSPRAAQYFFGGIFEKLLDGASRDILSPFHPLLSPYRQELTPLKPPLVRNRVPPSAASA